MGSDPFSSATRHRCLTRLRLLALGSVFLWTAAASDVERSPNEAMAEVLAADQRLGTIRNRASERMPLARAVAVYVDALASLDLSHCPPDFREALKRHEDAWRKSLPFFERFPDLRGEMHDVFEEIRHRDAESRSGLESAEAAIWGTWAEVEAAFKRHEAASPEPQA